MTRFRASHLEGGSPPAVAAFIAYQLLAIVMTWPLLTGVASDVPGDLGDSLLNMWILGWGAEHVPRLLTGEASISEYWNANIFHPAPLTLGFSEHLFGEVLQILPVYWLTGNLILCYNLLFLSSFALSGVGMFLLVRDLLGARRDLSPDVVLGAAFIAGLLFAFVPFRIAQVAHIQSLHAQWMPFALYGFRRFILTGRTSSLTGGAIALLMQHWSNGYYMLFFAPFVPLFVIHQVWIAGRLRDVRIWASFVVAAIVIAIGTWPFLSLYLETQRVHGFERPLAEVVGFSADVYSYLTAPPALRIWGDLLQAHPKAEGELFFGVSIWMLCATALLAASGVAFNRSQPDATRRSKASASIPMRILRGLIVIQTIGLLGILFTGGFITSVAGIPVRATNASRIVIGIVVLAAILLAISPDTRRRAISLARSPFALTAAFALLALWLSLGPMPQSAGRGLPGMGLYSVLYENVPGFSGLRVPARYAMIAALFLSVVAGLGAATLLQRARRVAVLATVLSALFLVDVWFAPMPVNVTWGSSYVDAPPRVYPREDAPPVYHQLAEFPDNTVVAEFPFGDTTWELRYVYYSTVHWKRLVNGYSGGFPGDYMTRVAHLQRVREDSDGAWRALRQSGATHVVVHQRAFAAGEAAVIIKWLNDHFAVEIARFDDGDLLFDVTGVWPPQVQGLGIGD